MTQGSYDGRSVTAQRVGRLFLISHGERAPSDREWDELLGVFANANLDQLRLLVFTEGGAPSPAQQARLASALASRPGSLYVAVLSDRTAIRFVASTIALFVRRLRTFRRYELEAALTYLQLAPSEQRAAWNFLGEEERSGVVQVRTLSSTSSANGTDR